MCISASAIDSSHCQFLLLLLSLSPPEENFPAEPHTALEDNDHGRRSAGYLNNGCHQRFPFSRVQPRYFGLSNIVDIVQHTFCKVNVLNSKTIIFAFWYSWKWNKNVKQVNVKQQKDLGLNVFHLAYLFCCLSLNNARSKYAPTARGWLGNPCVASQCHRDEKLTRFITSPCCIQFVSHVEIQVESLFFLFFLEQKYTMSEAFSVGGYDQR